jgi:flagella basal body P-ring formation protein FlgA
MSQQSRLPFTAIIFLLAALSASPALSAATSQNLVDEVHDFVQNLVDAEYAEADHSIISVQAPDARLDLSACTMPQLNLHNTTSLTRRVLIRVRCDAALAFYLPVDIEIYVPMLVARTALARHTLVSASDIVREPQDVLRTGRHYLADPADAIGKHLKRAVRQGSLLTPRTLEVADAVSRGDAVVILAERGSLMVRMQGTAMGSGAEGDQISVKNSSSARVIKAMISAPGEVTVVF